MVETRPDTHSATPRVTPISEALLRTTDYQQANSNYYTLSATQRPPVFTFPTGSIAVSHCAGREVSALLVRVVTWSPGVLGERGEAASTAWSVLRDGDARASRHADAAPTCRSCHVSGEHAISRSSAASVGLVGVGPRSHPARFLGSELSDDFDPGGKRGAKQERMGTRVRTH